jgi:diaminopimelate epimerase
MQFYKFQALGNDFLITRQRDLLAVTNDIEDFARRICDRHFGAGADGLELLLERPSVAHADFEVRLFNADGGETPISGNGTRCVAAYLFQIEGWDRLQVRIATGAGVKILRRVGERGNCLMFESEMGLPRLKSDEIPLRLGRSLEQVVRQKLDVDGRAIEFTAVSMGNPHCSIFVDNFDSFDWRALGAAIEVHHAFPDRTNVEFVRVIDRKAIEVRFWERGCGETLASGTGSCGAALASMLNGLTDKNVSVLTPGGTLMVEWREDGTVVQTGEACPVYRGDLII